MPQTDSKQIDKRDLGYDFIRFIATMMIVIHHFVTTLHSNNLHVPHDLQLFYCFLFFIGITFLSSEALNRATNFILNFVSSLQFRIRNNLLQKDKDKNNVTL